MINYLSITESARKAQVSRQRIWELIQKNRFSGAHKTSLGWLIPDDDVDMYIGHREYWKDKLNKGGQNATSTRL